MNLTFKNDNEMKAAIKKLDIEDLKDNQLIRISDDNCKYEYRILKDIKKFEPTKNFSYIFVNPVNLNDLYNALNTSINNSGNNEYTSQY